MLSQKAQLQNATIAGTGSAIMNFGGTFLGGASSGDTTVEQNSPVRKRAEAVLMSPKADLLKKEDVKENPAGPDTTETSPKEVPAEKIDVDVNLDDITPKSEGPKMNILPIQHLPNLAEAQFDAPLENVPMPTSLMEFTKEHWDTLVMSLIAVKNYV
jgi:hypothetical protein